MTSVALTPNNYNQYSIDANIILPISNSKDETFNFACPTPVSEQKDNKNLIDRAYVFQKEKNFNKIISKLEELKSWPKNWDSYGSEKPDFDAINYAKDILEELFKSSLNLNYNFSMPHVSASSDGEIVFEWWCKDKKLTLYVTSQKVEYIKVVSDKIEDMEDGELNEINIFGFQKLFGWLAG